MHHTIDSVHSTLRASTVEEQTLWELADQVGRAHGGRQRQLSCGALLVEVTHARQRPRSLLRDAMMDGGSTPPPQRDPRTVLSQPYVIPTPIRRVSSQQHVPGVGTPPEGEDRRNADPAAGTGLDPPVPSSPKKPPRVTHGNSANPAAAAPAGNVWTLSSLSSILVTLLTAFSFPPWALSSSPRRNRRSHQ